MTTQAKTEFQKPIRRANDGMGHAHHQILKGAEVRRAEKFAIPQAGATMEAQTNRYGKWANTITRKKEMLQWESLPPNEHYLYFDLPRVGKELKSVTKQVVELATFPQPVRKAPGQDKVSFGAVHLLYISKMDFSHWKPRRVSERMWSVNFDASSSGQYEMLGAHSCWASE